MSLKKEVSGEYVLVPHLTLMEIKCSGAIPNWLSKALSKNGLFKTSFSKYGNAYINSIYPNIRKDAYYA